MKFIEFTTIVRRHKLMLLYGFVVTLLLATFSAYKLDGGHLVLRANDVYESRAVVAVKPGAEVTTTTAAPTTTVPAPPTTVAASPASSVPAVPTTTIATPPLAPLGNLIDSRSLYYSALSIKTVVASPGFAEAVRAQTPSMDGSVSAAVAQDTNTIDIVVDGSTPAVTAATMQAALTELRSVVASYATSPATRFTLDGLVVSAPSAPSKVKSIRGPLTFALVFVVVASLWWFVIRAIDHVQRHGGRRITPPKPPPPTPRSSNGTGSSSPRATSKR